MTDHETIVGALHAGLGASTLLGGIIVLGIFSAAGAVTGDWRATGVLLVVGTAIACLLFIMAVPQVVGGVALILGKRWARVLVLVIGALNLLHVPFGTILGVYTLWALTREDSSMP